MVKVEIVNENKKIEVKSGTSMQEALDGTGIIFGCTNGLCGVCIINVLEGMENISEKTKIEIEQLEFLNAEKNQRLACQCKINGDVKIEYLNECG